MAAALLAVLTAIHFIFVFTRDLRTDSVASGADDQSLSPQLRDVFIYGYVFMLAALSLCVVPFFLPIDNDSSSKAKLPAGVVAGVLSTDTNTARDQESQWFLHIGSTISKKTRNNSETDEDSHKTVAAASYDVLKGGLAVPLYVVFLALMGGAVSMIRRVPEYQKRATHLYQKEWEPDKSHDTGEEAPISEIRARELVVFQIMQMFTAPLIAITAHAVFSPEDIAAAGLLGFLSGFASEPILLRLRKLADALSRQTNIVR